MSIDSIKVVLLGAASLLLSHSIFAGVIIIDGTASKVLTPIKSNLGFKAPGDKSDTPMESPGGTQNAINYGEFQILTRNIPDQGTPHELILTVGANNGVVSANNNDPTINPNADPLTYFANGEHLFDIKRFRSAADWLAQPANVTPDVGVAPGQSKTYGTIMFKDFLENIANNRTMYGLVRVLVPMQQGDNNIYGFCGSAGAFTTPVPASKKGPGCECAPVKDMTIGSGKTVCNISFPANSAIKVKGALMWDYVDYLSGLTVPLNQLPEFPRDDLYFKVEVPIWVNWSKDIRKLDANDEPIPDSIDIAKFKTLMEKIKFHLPNYASIPTPAFEKLTPPIPLGDIPDSAKKAYNFQVSGDSSSGDLDKDFSGNADKDPLSVPNQFHLLMPVGYAEGWADAFNKLNLTRANWVDMPVTPKFKIPATAPSGTAGPNKDPWTADDFRSEDFEDIPTYMYTGGMVDMHSHVFISGLAYIPQALELEAKTINSDTSYQYIMGAVLVRDGFYIEQKGTSITIISTDPSSFSNILIKGTKAQQNPIAFGQSMQDALSNGTPDTSPNTGLIVGLPSSSGGNNNPGTNNLPPAAAWTEIVPTIPNNLP